MPRNHVKAEFVSTVIRPFLKGPHPYPRGRAVIALGDLLKENAIPDVVELATDKKESRYKLEFIQARSSTKPESKISNRKPSA